MKKIAIITLNYNGKKDTLELLESLKKLKIENGELRIVVVDNASGDGSVSAIHQAFPEVDIVQAGDNLGFSGGYNKGIDYAKIWGADYFLLINNDCLIKDDNLLDELLETINSDPKIGLVSPKIYFAPGFEFHKNLYGKGDIGKVIWFAGGKFDWNNIGSIHRGIDQVDEGDYDNIEEQEIVSGACVLIKKEVFEKVGLFDENYFLYFEDSDFVKRANTAGFKNYYDGKVAIYHKVSQSTGIGSLITDYYHTRNRLIFGMKYATPRTKFALIREALKLLLLGRPAQRQGVLDYYLGIVGHHLGGDAEVSAGVHLRGERSAEYPFKLSIGIVNYNTPLLTKKLLQSIFDKTSGFDPKNMEVIVLDNGKVDPCKEQIKEFLLKIKYLANSENEGFSKGYNKTIKYSLGKYYLMLNSDIEVLKGGISELIRAEEKLNGEAVLGGKLEFPDGSNQDSAFNLPTLSGAFKEYFLAKSGSYFMYQPGSESRLDSRPHFVQNPPRSPFGHLGGVGIKVEGLVMACMLIPKKILDKAGLVDEGTFIFFEDIEYCRRLNKLGVPVYFVPKAKFIHHHGSSTKKIGLEKANEHLTAAAKYYHGNLYFFLLSLILRLGQKLGNVTTPKPRWTKT